MGLGKYESAGESQSVLNDDHSPDLPAHPYVLTLNCNPPDEDGATLSDHY
jgi:hypothetical protein